MVEVVLPLLSGVLPVLAGGHRHLRAAGDDEEREGEGAASGWRCGVTARGVPGASNQQVRIYRFLRNVRLPATSMDGRTANKRCSCGERWRAADEASRRASVVMS